MQLTPRQTALARLVEGWVVAALIAAALAGLSQLAAVNAGTSVDWRKFLIFLAATFGIQFCDAVYAYAKASGNPLLAQAAQEGAQIVQNQTGNHTPAPSTTPTAAPQSAVESPTVAPTTLDVSTLASAIQQAASATTAPQTAS